MASDKKAHKMSEACLDMDLGGRVGWWVRMAWPNSRAKNLARLLDISESQAKRIIGGAAPTSDQITKMAKAWGWRFVIFVFEGMAGPERPVFMMQLEMDERDQRVADLRSEKEAEDARGGSAVSVVANAGGRSDGGAELGGMVREDKAETASVVAHRKVAS